MIAHAARPRVAIFKYEEAHTWKEQPVGSFGDRAGLYGDELWLRPAER